MATQEGTAKSGQFVVICSAPDVCKSPAAPVPYQIVAYLDQSVFTSPNVRFKGVPVFDMASRVATVIGDEAGTGGGVVSGVNMGFCKPLTPVPTVRCNGIELCRHEHTQFEMNCAGPDGPGNTIGKVVYLGAMQSAAVGPGGTLPPGSNSIVAAESPGELKCLGTLDSIPGMGGGLSDVVGMAQRAYNLASNDWSNPMAALGAIGGLAGIAGFGSVARTAGLAQKAYGLAMTDWSNPGAVIRAASGAAALAGSDGIAEVAGIAKQGFELATADWQSPGSAVGGAMNLAGPVLASGKRDDIDNSFSDSAFDTRRQSIDTESADEGYQHNRPIGPRILADWGECVREAIRKNPGASQAAVLSGCASYLATEIQNSYEPVDAVVRLKRQPAGDGQLQSLKRSFGISLQCLSYGQVS